MKTTFANVQNGNTFATRHIDGSWKEVYYKVSDTTITIINTGQNWTLTDCGLTSETEVFAWGQ